MPPRSIGSATISFGLVSIPVRLYVATHSEQISFNLLHAECGTRIKQQTVCPHCNRVVERSELVKGREVARDRYVTFTSEELEALEAAASPALDIQEFVPLADVDPVYFEDAHYLGADKGGEKAYRLLVDAMTATGMGALAQHVSRGKEHLVMIRPRDGALVLHTLYYADEVRSAAEIEIGAAVKTKPAEVELARKLVAELSHDAFHPEQYHDHWRERVEAAVQQKVAGEEVQAAPAVPDRAQVIDLMDALKQSLARGRGKAAAATADKRRPAAAARTSAPPARKRASKK